MCVWECVGNQLISRENLLYFYVKAKAKWTVGFTITITTKLCCMLCTTKYMCIHTNNKGSRKDIKQDSSHHFLAFSVFFPRVWSVRYNHSHDQLVLTASSDSRLILSNMVSISSEPFGHLVDEEELSEGEDNHQEDK